MGEHDSRERSVGIVETQYLKLELPEGGFKLEKGGVLPEIVVAYERCGKITAENDNVVFVCHALTGDAHVAGMHPDETSPSGWWEGMFGPGKGVDTDRYQVICANVLGGCMGTTGPSSIDPRTGRPYGSSFPKITMSDIVDVNRLLLKQLGIQHVSAVIGGSFGGILVIDWVTRHSADMDKAIVIASASHMSSQSLAFDLIGRNAIVEDPKWKGGDYYGETEQPDAGLTSARQIAHITYLSNEVLEERFGRERRSEWLERARSDEGFRDEMDRGFHTYFQLESYLRYQGSKFCKRFDANSYLHITLALDEYDAAEKFGSLRKAFRNVTAKLLFVSLSGDWLFEPKQSEELVHACLQEGVRVSYCQLDAPSGHDAFLTHISDLKRVIRAFLPPSKEERGPAYHRWQERHYANVVAMVPKGSRVADLGCGDGALISILQDKCDCTGYGVEMDIESVIKAIASGCNVVTADLDGDLSMIPSGSADIAILSETLQTIRKPRSLMERILNVAEEALVSFPNFACWDVRLRLLFSGRMPKGKQLPFEWYDTPNIHLFTLKDFLQLCRDESLRIVKFFYTPRGWVGRFLCSLGWHNFGASRVTVRLARDEGRGEDE